MKSTQRAAVLNRAWGDGVETHCASGVLTDRDVAHLLVTLAEDSQLLPCGNANCDSCSIVRGIWWDLFDDLPDRLKARLVAITETLRIPLPDRDDGGETYHVVPTSQR